MMNSSSTKSFLTTQEAAEYLGLKPSTLEKWRVVGGGPEFRKLGGRSVRYHRDDLDAWAAANKRRNTSQGGQAA